MEIPVSFLGFGEAAQSFCKDSRWRGRASGFDVKSIHADHAEQKSNEYVSANVTELGAVDAFSAGTKLLLSLVTADQALIAANSVAPHLSSGTLYLGMNSVAPTTKKEIENMFSIRGVDYVDVAIMAPVYPKQLDVPLLVSGKKADHAEGKLSSLGFQNIRIVGDEVGKASSIKMLRSVMVKGIEALTAECAIAAEKAGVMEDVFGSMGSEWLDKVNYNLDRMMVHGQRRAAEMHEVTHTLSSLGISPLMSEGTVGWQEAIGELKIDPPDKLREKLNAIMEKMQ